jgi:hypothetical protein
MLIGLARKFIFISNLKSASTAIEVALRPLAEIIFTEQRDLKHLPFSDIQERFSWIFDMIPRQEFLIFGVIRDPIDFMISLYNSHTKNDFKTFPTLYTGEIDFDEFLATWCPVFCDQIIQQYTRLLDNNGHIAANFIISYHRLSEGLQYVASRIDAPGLCPLAPANVSPHRLSRNDLTRRQLAWISQHFEDDQRFMERFCDRLLTPAEQRSWKEGASPTHLLGALQQQSWRRPWPFARVTRR